MSASAPADVYTLDDFTTLDLNTSGGTTVGVAGVQEVTVVANVSIEQLYTADSIKIADQLQHEAAVEVEVGYSYWDGDVAGQWLGGDGSTGTSLTDTTSPQKYELTGTFESRDGSNQIDMTVTGITFEEMPLLEASRGEYVQWDLSGTGEDVTNYDITTPA